MYFGLITTTRDWYQSAAAVRLFQSYSIIIMVIWIFLLFLHFKPSLLRGLQGSTPGSVFILLLGIVLAFALIGLIFGMGWYLWRLDASPIWVRMLWVLTALVLSPFVEVAYFALVYRRQVLRTRAE